MNGSSPSSVLWSSKNIEPRGMSGTGGSAPPPIVSNPNQLSASISSAARPFRSAPPPANGDMPGIARSGDMPGVGELKMPPRAWTLRGRGELMPAACKLHGRLWVLTVCRGGSWGGAGCWKGVVAPGGGWVRAMTCCPGKAGRSPRACGPAMRLCMGSAWLATLSPMLLYCRCSWAPDACGSACVTTEPLPWPCPEPAAPADTRGWLWGCIRLVGPRSSPSPCCAAGGCVACCPAGPAP